MIAALIEKDLKLFFRNQFFALITGLGLVFYLVLYFLLPVNVDQTLPLGLYVQGLPAASINLPLGEGLTVQNFDSREAMVQAVEAGDYLAGLSLPAAAFNAIRRGEPTTLEMYYAPGTVPEMREAINSVLASRINALAAPETTVNRITEVVGPQVEHPLSIRDRVLPTLLMLILTIEVMGLATLIVEEVEQGTAAAVLTTPLGLTQFLTSKAIMGMGLAFVQVFFVAAVTGQLFNAPLLITVTLLLGCLFITGVGFLIASVARDMVSVMAWGILFLVVLVLPSITVMLPAMGSGWIRYIPSFYLVDTLHQVTNYGASWGDVSLHLLTLLVIGVGTLLIGSAVLRRRFQ
jgi:ABC-2 type transport system permease protein